MLLCFSKLDLADDELVAQVRHTFAPLGYRLIFASELQALVAHRGVARDVNVAAIDLYLSWGYIPAPITAFAGVSKLPPAHGWSGIGSCGRRARPSCSPSPSTVAHRSVR